MKSQNNNQTIGDKIKLLRNKQGLTQDELARKSDLPQHWPKLKQMSSPSPLFKRLWRLLKD